MALARDVGKFECAVGVLRKREVDMRLIGCDRGAFAWVLWFCEEGKVIRSAVSE